MNTVYVRYYWNLAQDRHNSVFPYFIGTLLKHGRQSFTTNDTVEVFTDDVITSLVLGIMNC